MRSTTQEVRTLRFKLGLLIGFGLGWLAGKDVLLTFFQGLRKPGASTGSAGIGSSTSTLTGSSTGSGSTTSTGSPASASSSSPSSTSPVPNGNSSGKAGAAKAGADS